MTTPRYKAFISYSHRDEVWARWLQHALEKYRVPKRLVGTPGAYGPIPARLNPVFRDREDLSSASDLTTQIKGELANSETLVVICSPAAFASPWVNEEIGYFREIGRGERIFALIVEGDPQASDPSLACFPTALLATDNGDKKEPLAADARKYADGKQLALLKIVAGILGIRLDELRRRDAQRRTRNRIVYSLTALSLVFVIGWLAYSEATTRAAAQVQQANTEELLGFMLGDLKRLAPIDGLEVLTTGVAEQDRYRQELGFDELDNESLVAEALTWRDKGSELQHIGDFNAAMVAFKHSRAAIIELHQREGNTARALFELGQAEFYVGAVYWYMGELDLAEQSWIRYGVVTRRLVNAEPNNSKYVMELSYTLVNLGALEQSRPKPDASRFLQLIQSSLQFNQIALVLDPANEIYREERATSLAWLSDAWLEKCELGNAFDSRQTSVEIRRGLLAENSTTGRQQSELAYTITGLAGVQQQIGLNEAAVENFKEALNILKTIHEEDPDNNEIEWELIYRTARLARHLQAMGRSGEAWNLTQPLIERMKLISQASDSSDQFMAGEAIFYRLDFARLLLARGKAEEGQALLRQATQEAAELVRQKPDYRENLIVLTYSYFEYWQLFGQKPVEEFDNLLDAYLVEPERVESCSDANQAARLAVIRGDTELARRYTDYALNKGYFEAGFVSFCKAYKLCDIP